MEEKSEGCSNSGIYDEKIFPLLHPQHFKAGKLLTRTLSPIISSSWVVDEEVEILPPESLDPRFLPLLEQRAN